MRQLFAYQPLLFSGVVGGERLVCSLVKYHQLKIWLPHSPNGAKSRQDGWFQRLRCGAGYDSRRRPVLFGRCPAGLTQTFSVRLFDEGSGFCGCATDWLGKFGGLERVGWGTAVFHYNVPQEPASQPVQSVRFGAGFNNFCSGKSAKALVRCPA